GFWMSHILLNDDAQSKKELLVALCAHLDHSLWAPAAARAVRDAGRVNDFQSLFHALTEIERTLSHAADPDGTRALLDEVRSLSAQIQAALAAGQHRHALQLARRQRQLILRADAAVQLPRPGEFVGVWDHDGTGYIPGDWAFTANHLAAHGVNAVFPNLAWGGCAHYPSKVLPASDTLRLYGDQLAAVLAAAKPRGMQVHVWFVLWQLTGAPDAFAARMKKEGRLQIAADGEGATRVIEVRVEGAATEQDARAAARAIVDSPLVKCAVHGGDPNWGRVVAAAGRSGARVDVARMKHWIGDTLVFDAGTPTDFDVAACEQHMKGPRVLLRVDLGVGTEDHTCYGCDLSRDYVTINADYHT
ncbi:MAG TPA: bifunctional ornithine acetyltransferase/N-acetylglutamate synthase, partial [Phycisphaerae bacterium]|nr:bifunctional ornithine acetyltransferase/N-acetylglutamate synthase [Phycisphaerae bacterium]